MGDVVSRDKRTSVPIADVPDAPLSTPCRDATLTHVFTVCCLSEHGLLDALHGGKDGGVGLAFLDDEPIADLVGFGHVLWKFAHVLIIRGQQWRMGQTADTWSGVTVIHAMGSPLAGHFQMTMGSPYFANHTEQRR